MKVEVGMGGGGTRKGKKNLRDLGKGLEMGKGRGGVYGRGKIRSWRVVGGMGERERNLV